MQKKKVMSLMNVHKVPTSFFFTCITHKCKYIQNTPKYPQVLRLGTFLFIRYNKKLAMDTRIQRKSMKALCETQLAVWNLQERVLYFSLFGKKVLHILDTPDVIKPMLFVCIIYIFQRAGC